jgi:Saxitoxin biosynthesis operon protein SxtJ
MESRLDVHENLSRDEEVKGPSERRFGLTFAVVLLILTAILTLRGSTAWPVPMALALAFLALAALAPNSLKPLNRLWLWFGLALHKIVSPVVLIALFFVVITPIGILARLYGKDFLRLRFDREATTYWIDRQPPGPRPESMRNQF